MSASRGRLDPLWILSRDGLVTVGVLGAAVALAAAAGMNLLFLRVASYNGALLWPFSHVLFRVPTPVQAATAVAAMAMLGIGFRALERSGYGVLGVASLAVVLVLASNLVQGYPTGFEQPIVGRASEGSGDQYIHDAREIGSASQFLASFNEIQPSLRLHSKTHPPGAVLVFYWLDRAIGRADGIGLIMGLVATGLTVAFMRVLLLPHLGSASAGYGALLLALVPAMQLYELASLDALIAAALLGLQLGLLRGRGACAWGGAAIGLFVASALTFGFLFVLPVMVGFEWFGRRSLRWSASLIASLAAGWAVIHQLWGFDYVEAFRMASALENPDGLRLVAAPLEYLFSRLECVGEIAWSLGPYLFLLVVVGLRPRARLPRELRLLVLLALVSLGSMMGVGAYKTGETARACLFIFPYLLLPALWVLPRGAGDSGRRFALMAVVYGQGLAMQLFGDWVW